MNWAAIRRLILLRRVRAWLRLSEQE